MRSARDSGETDHDGGCRYNFSGGGLDNAVRFTALVYDMDCQFDEVSLLF